MRPKQQQKARHDDLFRARLDQIINMKHELVVKAWNKLTDQPGRIMSIGMRDWAHGC